MLNANDLSWLKQIVQEIRMKGNGKVTGSMLKQYFSEQDPNDQRFQAAMKALPGGGVTENELNILANMLNNSNF